MTNTKYSISPSGEKFPLPLPADYKAEFARLGKNRINTMIKMNRLLLELDEAFDIMLLSCREYERDRGIPGTLARYASREGIVLYAA